MKNSINRWLLATQVVAIALLSLTACEETPDIDLPLAVNSDLIVLPTQGGSTRVQVYANDEWSASLSEDVDWASLEPLRGPESGSVIFSYATNYDIARSVDIVFKSAGLTKSVTMRQSGADATLSLATNSLESFSNAWDFEIALNNNLESGDWDRVESNVTYKVIPHEDDDDQNPQPDQMWIEDLAVGGDKLTFSTLENATIRYRVATIELLYVDAFDVEHRTSVEIEQSPEDAYMTPLTTLVKATTKGQSAVVEFERNIEDFIDNVDYEITYKEASVDWIENVVVASAGRYLNFDIKPNDFEDERSATIQMVLKMGDNKILLGDPITVEQNFEFDVRTLITAESGEVVVNNPKALFDGYVISDSGNLNIATPINSSPTALDTSINYKTAYVQTIDGGYGLRLIFDNASDNTLSRYSNVKIDFNGATLVKEANPERYTIKGVVASNITSQTAGDASNLVEKRRSIGQLTDEDLYTYVSLSDVEFALPDGAFTNINEGYSPRISATPRALYDKSGDIIYTIINTIATWRRDGSPMPAGNGVVSGVIVHDKLPRSGFTNDGYIGDYQIRVLEKEDIEISASNSSSVRKTLVEWNWENGAILKNDDDTLKPNVGDGSLWATDAGVGYLLKEEYNGLAIDATKGKIDARSMTIEPSYWWNFSTQEGYAVALKFSTVGAGEAMSLNFTNMQGNGGSTSIFGPTSWHIEYSTDGVTFTKLDDSGFCARPFVFWTGTMTYCATAGNADRVFILPDELRNQSEVTLHIKASSPYAIASAAATVEEGDTKLIESTMAANMRSPMRFGTISIKSNK